MLLRHKDQKGSKTLRPATRVGRALTLEAVAALRLLADHIQDRVDELSALCVAGDTGEEETGQSREMPQRFVTMKWDRTTLQFTQAEANGFTNECGRCKPQQHPNSLRTVPRELSEVLTVPWPSCFQRQPARTRSCRAGRSCHKRQPSRCPAHRAPGPVTKRVPKDTP